MALTHVDKPIRIGSVTAKNRVVRSAHTTAIGGGTLTDDLIAYHEARAKGGVGLTVMEAFSVHRTSLSTLNIIDPSLAESYPRMMERMRAHDMRVFQQLFHAGQHGRTLDGSPPWAPTDQASYETGQTPIRMTKGMIDEIVGAYAYAAQQLKSWGCEGVELHAGHGFLPQQFLAAYSNDRTDDYGGSQENRARFIMEALAALRAAVGDEFVVGIRLSPDMMDGGLGVADNRYVALAAERAGLIDYVSVSAGNFQTINKTIGGMHEPTGFELAESVPIVEGLTVPKILVGRFRTLEEADQVIRAGDADMVAMVRATIADPDLVAKTLAGHPEQVRPCIACNQGCIGQLLAPPHRMGCAVNPAVGFERKLGDDRLAPAEAPRKVLVVGGGPAGMEAARVAALRGHTVVLAEADSRLGGAAKLAAQAPHRANIRDLLVWLEDEIYRLGVEVRTSTYMDAADVAAEAADAVILAVGSLPRMDGVQLSNPMDPIEGIGGPTVLSSFDLFLAGNPPAGKTAVVIDDTGHYEAVACAEYLAEAGADVAFVTRHISFAPLVESALMTKPVLERLSRGAFSLYTRTRAISIGDGGVVVAPTYLSKDTNRTETLPADTVVFVSHNQPIRDLAEALAERGIAATTVGDANGPRFLPTAIREGNLAGAKI